MTGEREDIWETAARYISGESTSEDDERIRSWKAENEINRRSLRVLETTHFRKREKISDDAKNDIFSRTIEKIYTYRSRSIRNIWLAAGAAASIVLLVTTAVLFYRLGQKENEQQRVEMYIPRGVKSKIVLPDGSTVLLNSDTRIAYPVRFNPHTREVVLDGEAYFSVTKDKYHPFVVKTGSVDVKVLGTKFNIRAYGSEDNVETTLEEGSVRVFSGTVNNGVSLAPDEQALWDKQKKTMHIAKVDSRLFSEWRNDKYYFKANSFEQITETLERVFDITIDIQSELLKKEIFTGEFERSEGIEHILSVIGRSTRINYAIKGQKIFITEKK